MALPQRKSKNKKTRHTYLIVCEGESTEKKYFSALKRHLMIPSTKIEPFGAGKSKKELVDHAIGKRKASKSVISTWVVFDKDNISNQDVDQTIKYANDNDIQVAFSNISFELWLLLHFSKVEYDMSLDIKRLYKLIEKHCEYKDYEKDGKSDALLLDKIAENFEDALKNSNDLYLKQQNIHKNPYCSLNKLVNDLRTVR